MGVFWSEDKIEKYEQATSFLNYPEIPLKPFFQAIINQDDTVLEIGSGVGIVTLYLAPMCKQVIAVETDADACAHINKRAKEQAINNIEVINSTWPNPEIEPADVSVSVYIYKAFNSIEKIRHLLESTKRTGIIMCTQPGRGGFINPLRLELGLESEEDKCFNEGCRISALLEAEGAKVRCEKVPHEFGQPVANIEEAASFMYRQLKVTEEYLPQIQELAHKYVEVRNGNLYVPYKRTNCVIIFEK